MTIYAQDRGLNVRSAIIRTEGKTVYIDEPCKALQEFYNVPYTVNCGEQLIAAVPTAEDAERLVKAIAAAERDGKPFITVCGGNLVDSRN